MKRVLILAALCLSCSRQGEPTIPRDKILYVLRLVVEAMEHSTPDATAPVDASVDASDELPRSL